MKDQGSKKLLLRWLKTAYEKIEHDLPLDGFDLNTIHSIIGLILEGYDARPALGIAKKVGIPRSVNSANRAVAYDYWSRRHLPGPDGAVPTEKVVAMDVAQRFDLSVSGVRTIAERNKALTMSAAKELGWKNCAMLANLLAGDDEAGPTP